MIVALLMKQPDFGMTVVVTAVWFAQFFLAGLPLLWVGGLRRGRRRGGLVGAYFLLPPRRQPHRPLPRSRRAATPTRSTARSRPSCNGGLFGRGPGEGTVKLQLPDAHADFIFAVAGEEFGLIACLLIVALFAFVVLRGFARLLQETNLFVLLAATGAGRPVRPAGADQHGLDPASDADQGHDPAVHLLWRLVDAGAGVGMGMLLALTRERAGLREAV